MRSFLKNATLFLIVMVLVSASFLIAPQTGRAQLVVSDPVLTVEQIQANILGDSVSWINVVQNTISAVANVADQINSYALFIKAWVLDPLAFVLSGNLLKSITAGIINFVNGQGNGTGQPQYVQNLRGHLLNTGDVQALAFFAEFGRNNNSPFGPAILSSLRINYFQGSSAAGYWAANRCTLDQYSSNPLAFVGGNFGQGGWSSWFALTTQPQNNPYSQYYRAQAELSARTAYEVESQLQQLAWGQGFLSWCGDMGSSAASESGFACPAGQTWNSSFQTCTSQSVANITQESCSAGQVWNASFQTCTSASVAGATNANCTKKDGTPGQIKTPGSVIRNALDKALGINLDKLAGMGEIGPDVNRLFSSLASTLSVVAYGSSLLGGEGSGGLFGTSQSSATSQLPATRRVVNQPGYGGATTDSINLSARSDPGIYKNPNLAANAAAAEADAVLPARPTKGGAPTTVAPTSSTSNAGYLAAWATLSFAANTAQNSLNQVVATCEGRYDTNASSAISTYVQPVLQHATEASADTAPSPGMVAQAQADASAGQSATVSSGSCGQVISITGGTLLDQLSALTATANTVRNTCVVNARACL